MSNEFFTTEERKRCFSTWEDRTVRVWDVAAREEALLLKGHSLGVRTLAFSPDGQRLVSGGEDGSVRIWDASPLTPPR